MADLDLRRLAELNIKTLLGKPWQFELDLANTHSFTGATITMTIKKVYEGGTTIQVLSVGSGITITSATKAVFVPSPLSVADALLEIEITLANGEVFRFKGQISAQ